MPRFSTLTHDSRFLRRCAPPARLTPRRFAPPLALEAPERRDVPSGGTVIASQTDTLAWGSEQVAVTATVTADDSDYPGLYLWQYHVANVNFTGGGQYAGAGVFGLAFSTSPYADVAHATGPGTWGSMGGDIFGGDGESWDTYPGSPDVIAPGHGADFAFTTLPRELAQVDAQASDTDFACHAAGTVLGPGDVPPLAAQDDVYGVGHDQTLTVSAAEGVLANDTGGDTAQLTAFLLAAPSQGAVTLAPDGSFSYTAAAGYVGTDSFTYEAWDGVEMSEATVTIDVGPVAHDDDYQVSHDHTLSVSADDGVLANDVAGTGSPLSATLVSAPSGGTLSLAADGSFAYTPPAGFLGEVSFTYQTSDGVFASNVATVTIDITNDAPVGEPVAYSTFQDRPLSIEPADGVLSDASDSDGDPVTAELVTGPAHGSLSFNADGSFVYTPQQGYAGPDSFTYRPADGLTPGEPAAVTIQVNQSVNLGVHPSAVAAADVNGDGQPDAIVADDGASTVSVFLRQADGTLATTPVFQVPFGPDSRPEALVAADFNHDGKADLAVPDSVSATVFILLGNGDGTFQAPTPVAVGDSPKSLALGDFNHDAETDLAVANAGSNSVSILLGDGFGGFTRGQDVPLASSPGAVAAGDVTGDGTADLVVSDPALNSIAVFAGNGDGTFQPPVSYAVGIDPTALVVADLNGDGVADVAVANTGGNTVSVLLATGQGMLASATGYAAGTGPVALVAADLRGSGNLDLAVADGGSSTVSYLANQGDGTFGDLTNPSATAATNGTPTALATGDFNGDGRNDLLVARTAAPGLDLLVTLAPEPPRIGRDPKYVNEGTPNPGVRGGFAWFVYWQIYVPANARMVGKDKVGPSATGGYILQHVVRTIDVRDIDNPNQPYDADLGDGQRISSFYQAFRRTADNPYVLDYWEAWRVDRDSDHPADGQTVLWRGANAQALKQIGINTPSMPVSDMYLFGGVTDDRRLRGSITITGELYYIDGLNALPPAFRTYDFGQAPAGIIPCMPTRGNEEVFAAIRRTPGITMSERYDHSITATWDDRMRQGKTDVPPPTLRRNPE
jgi:hypothetical protein